MKKLTLLLALLVLPAWAVDTAAERGMNIELSGPAKSVAALVADLERNAAYPEAGCTARSKVGKTAKIVCTKANGALLTVLNGAPANVRWSISSANKVQPVGATTATAVAPVDTAEGCAAGCATMRCPPPNGPVMCCNIKTYQAC